MDRPTDEKVIELCSDLLAYFATQDHFLKFGDKASNLKMLQLSTSVPSIAKKLMCDLQELPDHKKVTQPEMAKNEDTKLTDLIPMVDAIELLFLDKGVRKISRTAAALLSRCKELKMPDGILLELEQSGQISLVSGTEDFPHYQRTGKI